MYGRKDRERKYKGHKNDEKEGERQSVYWPHLPEFEIVHSVPGIEKKQK